MKRTRDQLLATSIENGIYPGTYVSWKPPISSINRRYGCVMSFDNIERDEKVDILASNGRVRVRLDGLRTEHDCGDVIVADQAGIYGPVLCGSD